VVIIVRPGVHLLSEDELEAEIRSVAPLLKKRAAGRNAPHVEGAGRGKTGADGRTSSSGTRGGEG
jgi:hypothetical protein